MDSYPRNHFYIIFAMVLKIKIILFYLIILFFIVIILFLKHIVMYNCFYCIILLFCFCSSSV